MAVTTRGPLPPGVYWRRRLAVLSLAVVVFICVGRVLDSGSDGSSRDKAEAAGATTLADPTATALGTGPAGEGAGHKGHGKRHGKGHGKGHGGKGHGGAQQEPSPTPSATPTPVLPDPSGPCADDDVYITPSIAAPVGGSDITVMLNLQTRTAEACTWQVSPDTVRLDIVSGHDKIWLSKDCPTAIPAVPVVVRLASVTQVPVTWSSRRSDEECSDRTAWALPGFYHAQAAALGGEATDVQFELVAPAPATVTATAKPSGGGQTH